MEGVWGPKDEEKDGCLDGLHSNQTQKLEKAHKFFGLNSSLSF